jgi:hypothetical protein
MRTKTLLLTAALSAAGLASSMAQVYSVNAVGYVNTTIPAGKQAILVNPLNGTNNNINTIIPLPNNAGYDSANNRFKDPLEWFDDFGWFSATEDNPAINPGEGFFFRNAASTPLTLTFVGEVPQGSLSYPVPGNNRLGFAGSQVPQAAPLGDTTINSANSLQFPADPGDAVFRYNTTTGRYGDPFEYFADYGWFSATGDVGPAGPTIAVGTGFAVRKLGAGRDWNRNFSVN